MSQNECGCCRGISALTPTKIDNPPGLSAVAYRMGTFAQFKRTMLARLSKLVPDMKTRQDNDFSIALLDAWAVLSDVLTFYQERIAQESYLRTATERFSLIQLSRLIGYRLRPGVAANAYLAFILETADGSPAITTVDIGTKVQSLPGPGETPQTFETIEKIEARTQWNSIRPKRYVSQKVSVDMQSVLLKGTSTNLKTGDPLLIVESIQAGNIASRIRRIRDVLPDTQARQTTVVLETNTRPRTKLLKPKFEMTEIPPVTKPAKFKDKTMDLMIGNRTLRRDEVKTLAITRGLSERSVLDAIKERMNFDKLKVPSGETGVFAFRVRANLFGYNAPPEETRKASAQKPNEIYLDSVYNTIRPNSWVLLVQPDPDGVPVWLTDAFETGTSAGKISGKSTQLILESEPEADTDIRTTTVYAQSESLVLADLPDPQDVIEKTRVIVLDDIYEGLERGQTIILTDASADSPSETISETAVLEDIVDQPEPQLILSNELINSYRKSTVLINANVAAATHGESKSEVLGSGDASKQNQRFVLKQFPLTHITSSTSSGAQSTLQIRVDDLLWKEVQSLYGCGPRERVFVTSTEDDGKTYVEFGDGRRGVRPATGRENIKATYRKGIGMEGIVQVDQLTLLMTRALGVKSVTNPSAASGAQDPEILEDARQNAPLKILTLDRIVSLQDYEDFARAFSGIAKASAVWAWSGGQKSVVVTIAGPDGKQIDRKSRTYKNLLTQLRESGDPFVSLRLEPYRPVLFKIKGGVKIDPSYLEDRVLADARTELLRRYSFDVREFGQGMSLSEVFGVMQRIPGVTAVFIDELYRYGEPTARSNLIGAALPRTENGSQLQGAELLTIDPGSLNDIGVVA